jgi:TrmH family RNA methyltransferase
MPEQITSTSNARVKAIRKLGKKKGRQESGLFYVEGLKLVGAALEQGANIAQVIYSPELLVSDFGREIIEGAQTKHIELMNVSESVFNSFSLKSGPQGIAALVHQNWVDLAESDAQKGLWAALEDVQDPGNLGSTLRSLDAAGGRGMILLGDSTDPYHPTAVRASMGAIFTQKLVKTGTAEMRQWKEKVKAKIVGTWCGDAQPYRSYNYPRDMILMMGSEQKGLQEEHLQLCDQLVHIPMQGYVDSLNLACAASVVLFEIHAQAGERK